MNSYLRTGACRLFSSSLDHSRIRMMMGSGAPHLSIAHACQRVSVLINKGRSMLLTKVVGEGTSLGQSPTSNRVTSPRPRAQEEGIRTENNR